MRTPAYDRVVLRDRLLHLAAGRKVDPSPVIEHRWKKPGRPLAHWRKTSCSCCEIELPWSLLHECGRCGLVPHTVRVRPRGGLSLSCRECKRRDARKREVPLKVSRRASRRYQARLRAARKAMRGAAT